MVLRTYPIRVGPGTTGTSGWMGREIDLETIASRSGLELDELKRTELGSVSGKPRRIAEFDWGQFARSVAINRPTDIALTFADYLTGTNRDARRIEDLDPDTLKFIAELERVSGAKVSLVSKAFAKDGVLGDLA